MVELLVATAGKNMGGIWVKTVHAKLVPLIHGTATLMNLILIAVLFSCLK